MKGFFKSFTFSPYLNQVKSSLSANNPLLNDFKDLLIELERRRYNTKRLVFVVGGVFCFLFYGNLKHMVSNQAVDVTTIYLENPKFRKDVSVFVEKLVEDLSKSERIKSDVTSLLKSSVENLTEDETVQAHLADMFVRLFQSEKIKEAGAELSKEIAKDLMHSKDYEELRKDLVDFTILELKNVVEDEKLQDAVGLASWNAFKVWFGINYKD